MISLAFLIPFVFSSLLTPFFRWLDVGELVDRPRTDRWSTRPVLRVGGIATFVTWFLAVGFSSMLVIPLSAMFLLGLYDDLRDLRWRWKLVLQAMICASVVFLGFRSDWTLFFYANLAFSFAWLLVVANGFNIIDNVDGLAGGTGVIVSVFLWMITGDARCLILGGAIMGFLVHNFPDARVYMGDSGSLFVGLALATMVEGLDWWAVFPVMIVPLWEVAFVTVARFIDGRSPFQGGRDHTSHRMMRAGLPHWVTVISLWGIGALGGLTAMILR